MAEFTQEDLITKALAHLGYGGEGQTASAEQRALIEPYIRSVLAQLKGDRVVYVIPAIIDDVVFMPLARLIANEAGPEMAGIARSRDVYLAGVAELRHALAAPYVAHTLPVDYF